jgi:hypothetical protein
MLERNEWDETIVISDETERAVAALLRELDTPEPEVKPHENNDPGFWWEQGH